MAACISFAEAHPSFTQSEATQKVRRRGFEMTFNPFQRSAEPSSPPDWSAVLILVLLAVWLFRRHFFDDNLWMGNPDRLNSDFKILKHYLSGLSGGHISAWDEHEMMGYDSFVLPYTFPNPLVYLAALFGSDSLYITMGYIEIAMLAIAGIAAYAFIRADLPAGTSALVGGICYEFSSLTLLKVSQNSMSFAVFIVIPLLALAIRHVRRDAAPACFLALAFLLACMLNLMFLQKAAYALILIGGYAFWRSWITRSWYPASVFSAALTVAVIFSAPRIIGVARALREYARVVEGIDFKDFNVLYKFQNILPDQFYRWFDYGIYGRTISEGIALGNKINLTEGFLFYTSAIVPFVLLTGLLRNRRGWLTNLRAPIGDAAYFFWFLVACVAVVVWKPAAHAMFLLFLRMDFTHARILIAALLPLSCLVALALSDLSPRVNPARKGRYVCIAGMVVGLFAALAIDAVAEHFTDTYTIGELPKMRQQSLVRIGLSVMFYVILLASVLRRAKIAGLRNFAYMTICGLLASQCLLGANEQINVAYTRNFLHPFNKGDFYYARRDEFHPPSAEQLSALHQRIEPERYRVALVCDQEIAGGFCGGHVPEFWQLRAIDGYYGLGVPRRLRALPWPTGTGLRTISFLALETMPWNLLGFLNVRWALVSGDGVYRNIVREGDEIIGRPDPATFKIVPSPARITPRVFFAAAVEPAASLEDAVGHLFRPDGIVDPVNTSFVEGLDKARRFEKGGAVTLKGRDDLLELQFDATSAERFLVLNDLYYPGWHADIDGRELPVFATNAVMRGVVVPAGTDHLRFRYATYSATLSAWMFRVFAVLATLGLFFGLRRVAKA